MSNRQNSVSGQSSPATEPCSAEPDRICSLCAESLPADQFRFRSRATGVRMHQCRSCHAATARARHRAKRARAEGWLIQKTASQNARSTKLQPVSRSPGTTGGLCRRSTKAASAMASRVREAHESAKVVNQTGQDVRDVGSAGRAGSNEN